MAQKKQGFVYGALILMLSNIIVKAVGAFFKIPLSHFIGDTAMGYFSSAYSVYSMCFLISTAGLPVAISRMIAAAKARGNNKEVNSIYRISLLIFIIIGTVVTAVLFFGADFIAVNIPKDPALGICIKTVAPIMFFICLVSCIRGYFQGHQNMVPTAVSQVIEAMGKLGLGLTAGIIANRNGYSPSVVAAFALGGVTLGVVASAFYMSFAKWLADRDQKAGLTNQDPEKSKKILAKQLIAIAIPITISSSVLSLTSVIDSMVAVGRLDLCVGQTYFDLNPETPVAMTLYGAYMAKAVTLFNLPPTIIYPFAINIIPAISSANAKNDTATLKKTMDFTFRIVSVIALPAAVGLGVLAKPIIDLLFSNDPMFLGADQTVFYSNDVVAPMLTILAAAIVFSGLISVSGAMLQAYGHEKKSIVSTFCGVAAKALLVWTLVASPAVGHYGIPISTLCCYFLMFLFNMYFLHRYVGYRLHFRSILLKPLLCSVFCGVCAIGAYWGLDQILPSSVATLGAIGVAAICYVTSLFKTGGFQKEDVLMLPKGETVFRILNRLKLVRS